MFPWADYNRKKAAFKLHVGLDHDGLIPGFAVVTLGRNSEMAQARAWDFPSGSVLVFDKGYNSYSWHNALTEQGLIWVTRIRGNALYRVIERRPVAPGSNVTSDQRIEYTGKKAQKKNLPPVRRIGYRDPETNKHYVFITNQFKWSAQTIADIYKQRWQVELFIRGQEYGVRPCSDKGYNSYSWHNALTEQGLIWVTRIRGNALYRVIERRPVAPGSNVTSDQRIEYTGKKAQKKNLPPVRRIGYRDPETNKHYVFITNQFKWSAQTIADIYKQRWQVELFFKWIKQNLKIKAFLGISENAVMTQVLVALCLYLLLAYLKFQSRIGKSLQQITRLLQMNLFIRRPLLELLQPVQQPPPPEIQLRLGLVRN